MREPEFIQDEDFRVIIWRKRANADGPQYLIDNKDIDNADFQSGPLNGPQSGPLNEKKAELFKRYRKLIETLIGNPKISKQELADTLGVGLTTIKRDINALRESYRIEWVGHAKTGRWEVERLK